MSPYLELPYIHAIGLGLLSALHCIGMCGGLTMSLSVLYRSAAHKPYSTQRFLLFVLQTQAGRITTYMLLGLLVGLIGQIFTPHQMHQLSLYLRALAGITLIFMGLYLGGWWQGINVISKLTTPLYRTFNPFKACLNHLHRPLAPLALGLVWGLLPCGLIYSLLVLSISQTTGTTLPTHLACALYMGAFGLGTLPILTLSSLGYKSVLNRLGQIHIRTILAASVIAFGIWTLVSPFYHAHHEAHPQGHQHHGH